MNIGVLTHTKDGEIVSWSAKKIAAELKKKKMDFEVADFDKIEITNGQCFFNQKSVDLIYFYYYRKSEKYDLKKLKKIKQPIINQLSSVQLSSDKYKSYQALKAKKIPNIKTKYYQDLTNKACRDINQIFKFPIVIKPKNGSGGTNIEKYDDINKLSSKLNQCSKADVIIQEYIDRIDNRDIRAYVVDGKVVGAIYRYGRDWVSNIARGAQVKKIILDKQLKKIALEAAQAIKLDIAGVDIFEQDGGYIVNEINSVPGFKKVFRATGVKIEGYIVEYLNSAASNLVK